MCVWGGGQEGGSNDNGRMLVGVDQQNITEEGQTGKSRCRETKTVVTRGGVSLSQATRVEPLRRGKGLEAQRREISRRREMLESY